MKIGINLMLVFFWGLSAMTQTSEKYINLSRFSQDGDMLPLFLGAPPSADFFQQSFDYAIERQQDYQFEISLSPGTGDNSAEEVRLLTLINKSDSLNSVCLSVEHSQQKYFQNFIVRLQPYGAETLDISEYFYAEGLRLISIQDFALQLDWPGSEQTMEQGDALEPSRDWDIDQADPTDANRYYCRDQVMTLRVEHLSGPYEDAHFRRTKYVGGGSWCGDVGWYNEDYELNIYWPAYPTLHHAGNGSGVGVCPNQYCSNIPCDMKCLHQNYSTTSQDDGTMLYWENIIETAGKYFDDVFFKTQCGKAICHKFLYGKCLDEPNTDWFWYVYPVGYRSRCF